MDGPRRNRDQRNLKKINMSLKYRFASSTRFKINRILKLDHFVNYCSSKNNFMNDSITYVDERPTIEENISITVRDTEITRAMLEISRSPKLDRSRGSPLDALLPVYLTPYFICSLVRKLTVCHFTADSY